MFAASMSSGTAGASPSSTQRDPFLPSSASTHSDVSHPSTPELVHAVPFSSGNPRVEGIMHLFHEDHSSPNNLPVDRKPLVCVLNVPNHMTYADFCKFCGSFVQHMLEMRTVRNDKIEDQYSVLIRFDDQSSTDSFFMHFKGKKFSSLEVDVCRVLYMLDVHYTGSIEHTQVPQASSTEQGNCPVCLERLEQNDGAILITICNHTFHCSCISKWADSSCPVCRYCQQREKSTCSICGTSVNVSICIICGFVGCGSLVEGHAIRHWKETEHCFSLQLESRRVWDYVEDNYVYRLLQSKTDGKIVELTSRCSHDANNTCKCCKCDDSRISDTLIESKSEAVIVEYDHLLELQLKIQRKHFESLLQEAKEEDEGVISNAIEKAARRLQKLHAKLDKSLEEKKFLEDINENLLKNQELWKAKIQQITEREQVAIRLKDEKLQQLEEQLKGLITSIEAQSTLNCIGDHGHPLQSH